MTTRTRFLHASLVATLLAACGASQSSTTSVATGSTAASPAAVNLPPAGSEAPIVVNRGDVLWMALPSNPSTGFSWELVIDPPDRVRVEQAEYAAEQEEGEAGAPERMIAGAGGTYRFELVAQTAGDVTLRFEYERAWEKEVPPAEVRIVRVTVR